VMLSLRIRLGWAWSRSSWKALGDLHGELLVEDFLGKFFAFGFDPFRGVGRNRLMHLRQRALRACR